MSDLQYRTVGKKQAGDNARWCYVWHHIGEIVSQGRAHQLVAQAVERVKAAGKGKRLGYAWSGGKDSQALRLVMEQAGVDRSVMGMTKGLEYPAFLAWATDNMPFSLDVIANEYDLAWLSHHPLMLFPQTAAIASMWFSGTQHRAQATFVKRYRIEALFLGRRRADGNYVGRNGSYTGRHGAEMVSPLYHWSHEDILGVCYWFNLPLPPCYGWVNGWVVGSGAWAARQWTGSTENGWREVYSIDPSIVTQAATVIPSARDFLTRL